MKANIPLSAEVFFTSIKRKESSLFGHSKEREKGADIFVIFYPAYFLGFLGTEV